MASGAKFMAWICDKRDTKQKYFFQDTKNETVHFNFLFYLIFYNEISEVYVSFFIKCTVVRFHFFAS